MFESIYLQFDENAQMQRLELILKELKSHETVEYFELGQIISDGAYFGGAFSYSREDNQLLDKLIQSPILKNVTFYVFNKYK